MTDYESWFRIMVTVNDRFRLLLIECEISFRIMVVEGGVSFRFVGIALNSVL
jgi:hypothetical protein